MNISYIGFTDAEMALIKKHVDNNPDISLEDITDAWRDEFGNMCVTYKNGRWYRYNVSKGEWS